MTAHHIFDKTEKGLEEISTRKHGLPSRLRSLLVLVDGKADVETLVKKVAGLGLNEESIAELLEQEFIAPHSSQSAAAVAPPVKAASPATTAPMQNIPRPSGASSPASAAILPEGETQFQALYNFYTTTIKNTLGQRGFSLQLKVERCGNIDEFKALRPIYLEALLKSKGPELARSLANRLDQLLNL